MKYFPLFFLLGFLLQSAPMVREGQREIPVTARVDVVVVGGTVSAVAAASACAKAGASVYLAAPRPYLGEDLAAPLRIWKKTDEELQTALANEIFSLDSLSKPGVIDEGIPFTYKASKTSGPIHRDSEKRSVLRDGSIGGARVDSVQYPGPEVVIDANFGEKAVFVSVATAYIYHRSTYSLATVQLQGSRDGETWTDIQTRKVDIAPQESPDSVGFPLKFEVNEELRFARFLFRNAPESNRILVGELHFPSPDTPKKESPPEHHIVRPLHLKKTLDAELLDAGVPFVYSSYPTNVIRTSDGQLGGVVIANRAGRQAILAKVVIDASSRAVVAQCAGVDIPSWPAGRQHFKRVVVGGKAKSESEILRVREIKPALAFKGKKYPVFEYDLDLDLKADSPAGWAELEQKARDLTYDAGQQFTSDVLWALPPVCISPQGEGVLACRPKGVDRLFVLGPLAGFSRAEAARHSQADSAVALGAEVGKATAELASRLEFGLMPKVVGSELESPIPDLTTHEFLKGARSTETYSRIPSEVAGLPVFGSYDVVVVGGGTSGAPAGIGAARNGAKTLVIEYLYGLGGVGTLGAISKYYHGYRGGFTKEVPGGASWEIEQRAEWWRSEIRKAGGAVWFGTLGCGSVNAGSRVRGVIVTGASGRGVVLAKTVIDSTGNADIAAAAGAECVYTDGGDLAVQGTGLPFRDLGASYRNTDFTVIDETDMVDVTSVFVYAKHKYPENSFDQGRIIDTRERRRIVGEVSLGILDLLSGQKYEDCINQSQTNYDTHGYTVDPFLMVQYMDKRKSHRTWTPYRALLPKNIGGMLVTGLGISVHRDCVPLIRMQPDLQNQGYAAGTAAAMVRDEQGGEPRKVDMKKLQAHLIEKGILPKDAVDSVELRLRPDSEYEKAARELPQHPERLALLMHRPERSLPYLRQAFSQATAAEDRLCLAQTLAVLGDPSGVPEIIAAVKAHEGWDKGWNYRSMGQFNSNMSPLDTLIYALGKSRDQRALPAILEKAALLSAEIDFSHHRSTALALESLKSPEAVPVLLAVLKKENMSGHALTDVAKAMAAHVKDRSVVALSPRRNSLREIYLARALYRCGDQDGIGRDILRSYVRDVRGHFSRHASVILNEK